MTETLQERLDWAIRSTTGYAIDEAGSAEGNDAFAETALRLCEVAKETAAALTSETARADAARRGSACRPPDAGAARARRPARGTPDAGGDARPG